MDAVDPGARLSFETHAPMTPLSAYDEQLLYQALRSESIPASVVLLEFPLRMDIDVLRTILCRAAEAFPALTAFPSWLSKSAVWTRSAMKADVIMANGSSAWSEAWRPMTLGTTPQSPLAAWIIHPATDSGSRVLMAVRHLFSAPQDMAAFLTEIQRQAVLAGISVRSPEASPGWLSKGRRQWRAGQRAWVRASVHDPGGLTEVRRRVAARIAERGAQSAESLVPDAHQDAGEGGAAITERNLPACSGVRELWVVMATGATGMHVDMAARGDQVDVTVTVPADSARVREAQDLLDAAAGSEICPLPVERLRSGPSVRVPYDSVLVPIRRWIQGNPAAVAIEDPVHGDVTYRDLGQGIGALESELASAGVAPGDHVVVALPRGATLVGVMLALWSAGAIYVPAHAALDANLLHAITASLGAAATVSVPESRGGGPWAVHIARAVRETAGRRDHGGGREGAYVFHTSGSTGQPKAVRVGHSALANLVHWFSVVLPPGSASKMVSLSSPTFDISMLEMLLPLVVGGIIAVIDEETAHDGPQLVQALSRIRPSLLQATPSTYRMLMASGWKGLTEAVLVSGGEALDCLLARELLRLSAQLWNVYGPTETTVWSLALRVGPEQVAGTGNVTIGRPIGNTVAQVTGPDGLPVPKGTPGELLIGGAGVAEGYVGSPQRTAVSFVPQSGGKRSYRTGDLVRSLPGGGLEFLGRADEQVKVRGHRIELTGIEASLKHVAGIANAAAYTFEKAGTGLEIGVALVLNAGTSVEGVAPAVSEVLGPSLRAARVTIQTSLPTTASGKVDRQQLARDACSPGSRTGAVFEPLERRIQRVVERVVGRRFPAKSSVLTLSIGERLRVAGALSETFGVQISDILSDYVTILADVFELVQKRTLQARTMRMPGLWQTQRAGLHLSPECSGGLSGSILGRSPFLLPQES